MPWPFGEDLSSLSGNRPWQTVYTCLVLLFYLSPAHPQDLNQRKIGVWFVEHPQYSVALPGDSVYFNCKTNSPVTDETIRWMHNGSLISQDDADFKMTKGHLSVKVARDVKTRSTQLGNYQCLSGLGRRFVASNPARLSIAKLDDFPVERPKAIEAYEGNDVVVTCSVPFSNPPAFVQFYKDDEAIDLPGKADGSDDDNMRILNGDTLLIYNSRRNNIGRYSCSAFNHITNQKKMSSSYTDLNITVPYRNEKSRLTFRPEERYTMLQGENLTVPCIASGHPKPDVIWTRVGNNQPIDSRHGCLTLTNAQQTDSGSYMCAIFNGARRFLRRTTVVVQVPPNFATTPSVNGSVVEEGVPLNLDCQALGTPIPSIQWTYNGLPVRQEGPVQVMANGTLQIPAVLRENEGVYQCFVSNVVGQNVTSVMVRVNGSSDSGIQDEFDRQLLERLLAEPPSKPNITQNGPDSALITWAVPHGPDAMPIQFFKIQFREFHKRTRSDWRTMDEVINARMRSFEVLGLKDDVKYRFRIVAVYADNDNLHGPLSKRFRLDKSLELDRAPSTAPVITEVLPLSQHSLRVGWKMQAVSPSTVEGYFIYIRERKRKKSERFKKITIIGHESHSYIFDDLKPGQMYEIKVEAFNFAGHSPPSKIARRSPPPLSKPASNLVSASTNNQTASAESDETDKEVVTTTSNVLPNETVRLYLILGVVSVVLVLVLVLCYSVASCVQNRRARKAFSQTNAAIHAKYADTSRQIVAQQNGGRYDDVNDVSAASAPSHSYSQPLSSNLHLQQQQSFASSIDNTAETSFSSPRRLSQMLHSNSTSSQHFANATTSATPRTSSMLVESQPDVLAISRNPNATALDDDLDSTSSASELNTSSTDNRTMTAGTGFEEYTDEPSRTSWKRRRRSEEFL